jgi:diguanylate cyclase (GGDEF)-like protein
MDDKQGCTLPDSEPRRLLALRAYDILDTGPEPEFEALARLAAIATATPMAGVAVLDADRLWFKSRVGLDMPELDRKVAICSHAILHPRDTLIVPDLAADPRFSDNPLVTGAPFLRFYAGAPIVDPTGMPLGTVAVMDTLPRNFDAAKSAALKDLASLAITALLARRRAMDVQRLALTDHLTGIANRAQFDKAVVTELSHSMRTGELFTVLTMDLDGFKDVNDRLGHTLGDEVLCEVARRLTVLVRQGDVLARLGGDEFGILMRHGSQQSGNVLRQRVLDSLEQPLTLSTGESLRIGISVGMAAYTDETESVPELLAQANSALLRSKRRLSH